MMRRYVIILSLVLQGCFWSACVEASEANLEWNDAVGFAKQGENDFAFMGFRTLSEGFPDTRRGMDAAFAQGEYYFLQNDFDLAFTAFKAFYARYPRHEESMVALAYLYQMAKMQKRPAEMKEYRAKAASFRQLTFIFSDKKSFRFLSGFQRRHKLVYYIDKVDLYVNGRLFTEIPF